MSTRLAWTMLAALLALLWLSACGGGSSSGSGAKTATTAANLPAKTIAVKVASTRGLTGDEEDDDEFGEKLGHNPNDSDADSDNDEIRSRGYYDRDDQPVKAYGHPATAAQASVLTEFVRRYYTAVAAADGPSMCSLLVKGVSASLPEDYGPGSAGPAYLRAGTTCAGILTLLFEHVRGQLPRFVDITVMRVQGDTALVLLGTRGHPASYLQLNREGGAWHSTSMLPSPLP